MSKIGRRPIALEKVSVDVKEQQVSYKGPHSSGVYDIPEELVAFVQDDKLLVEPKKEQKRRISRRDLNRIWGLHRALLSNRIQGSNAPFERKIQIVGLGYKAAQAGDKLILSLGYSHKIDFPVPQGVKVEIDKSGQKLTLKSADKEQVGYVSSMIRSLRPPEPYKGTGIRFEDEVVARKAGKAKSS